MDNINYFKELFESIPDYRKLVLGFSKSDINRLNLEFKNILLEEHEDYLD